MLTKATPDTLRAFAHLNLDDFSSLRKHLEEELQASYRLLAQVESHSSLMKMQGRVKFIEEFLGLVNDAPSLLAKADR